MAVHFGAVERARDVAAIRVSSPLRVSRADNRQHCLLSLQRASAEARRKGCPRIPCRFRARVGELGAMSSSMRDELRALVGVASRVSGLSFIGVAWPVGVVLVRVI